MSEKQEFVTELTGTVFADVDSDEFTDEFVIWLNSHGWAFAGVTKPQEDD